jgi:AraC-like DNA-binding protein
MGYYISTLVFSSGIIQGILLIIVLLRNGSRLNPNIFLSVFIAVVTLQVLIKLQSVYFHPDNIGPFYSILYFLPYLYGPLVYLYIKRSITENFALNLKMLLHLIPFTVSVFVVFVSGYKIINLFGYINNDIYNIADTVIQAVILSAYLLAGKKLLNNKTSAGREDTKRVSMEKWFNSFTNAVWITGIMLIILFTLVFYNVELFNIKFDNSSAAFLLLPMIIYWISYNALVKPELFIRNNTLVLAKTAENKYIKYQNNQLSNSEINSILASLNAYVENEKVYLNPEISLEILSKSVNIPRHHISQVINLQLNVNFNDYINLQRVEHAKRELLNPSKQHLTIAAIAFESGFNSISTFNEAFRKNTAMTPSEFKKRRFKP